MRQLILIAFLTTPSFFLFGQEVKTTTDKEKYKFDETIEVTFEINAEVDSINSPDFKGFKLVGGPTKNTSISIINGEKTVRKYKTYQLRAIQSGHLRINSPNYFINGQIIKGKSIKIKVDSSNLNTEELAEKKIQEFIEDRIKPFGTIRILYYEDIGYMEIYKENGWQHHRRLTSVEMDQMIK